MALRTAIAVLLAVVVARAQIEEVVNTTSGLVRGEWIQSQGVVQFLGIPYAEAPVGGLRFKPPVRKARMEGIYNATSNANICPQSNITTSRVVTEMTEDCLRLDIYVPKPIDVPPSDKTYPVMIWIHGGGYVVGDSAIYSSFFIARVGEVIVVTLNYRLGVLGFLNTMDENSVGNFGLRDQCAAIEWVIDNIREFSGDVSRVTIFGESAGASSVMQLAMSSLCTGKFQRVIAQSGSPGESWAYNSDPKSSSQKFAANAGCPTESSALVMCLRNKTWEQILEAQLKTLNLLHAEWLPSYSGDVFPDSPLDVIQGKDSPALRRFRSLDFLSGVCNEEGEFSFLLILSGSQSFDITAKINATDAIFSDESFEKRLSVTISQYANLDEYELKRLLPAAKFQYTDWKNRNDEFSHAKMLIQLHSDTTFNLRSIASANLHSSDKSGENGQDNRGNTYFYQFKPKGSWVQRQPWTEGSTHGEDIFFMFGFVNYVGGTQEEISLSNQMIRYWTNFAKTGSPNEPSLTVIQPEWPMYSADRGEYIELDLGLSNDSIRTFPYARRFAFWEQFFKPELKRIRAAREAPEKCEGTDISAAKDRTSSSLLQSLFAAFLITVISFLRN